MDKFHQELFDVLTQSRNNKIKRESKAASMEAGINKVQIIHNFLFSRH